MLNSPPGAVSGAVDPVATLLRRLQIGGVDLWEDSGNLRFRAPKGVLTEDDKQALRDHKQTVLRLLHDRDSAPTVRPAPEQRNEPFPLTDVQSAYLLGRGDETGYGGVACHVYLEIHYPDLDPARLDAAWNRLIARHEMLRVTVEPDGYQRVASETPPYQVAVTDLRHGTVEHVTAARAAVLDELGHHVHDPGIWPLFELRVTRGPEDAVLHLSLDSLVADWTSTVILLDELDLLLADPDRDLAALEITFRDYVLAERGLRETWRHRRDADYWRDRIDDLPPAPDLPVLGSAQTRPVRFRRRQLRLPEADWHRFRQRATQHGLTPSTAVLTAYATVVQRWSRTQRCALNVTTLNRMPLHPQVDQLVGDFTSVSLLAVDAAEGSFTDCASRLGAQLFDDLDHGSFSGIEVLRELRRRRGRAAALIPYVFTSAVDAAPTGHASRHYGTGITQTPQVLLDCQTHVDGGALHVNWDVREGAFPDGLVDDMFGALTVLLGALAEADSDRAWTSVTQIPLPRWQAEERRQAGATTAPLPAGLLQDAVLARLAADPEATVVVDRSGAVTGGEVGRRVNTAAQALLAAGCAAGERVAVVMDKGVEQVVAVLGVLAAGGVYVPVDALQPAARRDRMLADSGVHLLLTQSWVDREQTWPASVRSIPVDTLPPVARLPLAVDRSPDSAAYVIYTSGSTGTPKGVEVSHRAALNTVVDVNARFGIAAGDRGLGLANLGFDLSVYDVFGLLAAGGCLVLPDPGRRADPSHWAELVAAHRITVWNSVPAQLQMLVDHLDPAATDTGVGSLRVALLSGDWIPVTLPGQARRRVPDLTIVGLGGATEAAIWSNYHLIDRVDPDWPSIPYGRPLANQGYRVLDPALRDCPVWCAGELHISGAGLADGYVNDPDLTRARFITHPVDGTRLYRTGDFGRYRPGGEIEFLGREDTQVKIRGHRIELGEIEAVLAAHPAVGTAAVVADIERGLLGFAVPARRPAAAVAADAGFLDRVAATARRIADAETAGILAEDVERAVSLLDAAVAGSMLLALSRGGNFSDPSRSHDADEVLTAAAVHPRHHWLVRRWLALLVAAGSLVEEQGRYRCPAAPAPDSVEDLWRAVPTGDSGVAPRALEYTCAHARLLPELLTGEQDPFALLFPEGGLDTARGLYADGAAARCVHRAAAAVANRVAARHGGGGRVRVLEIGGGTGAATDAVLPVLAGFDVDYLFTDVTPFFLAEATERFRGATAVRVGTFDVERDHRAQGLAPNSFDIVLCAGVLDNAADVEAALAAVTALLVPGGWLIMTEPTGEQPWLLMTQGFLMAPVAERTAGGPAMRSRDGWTRLLEAAGAEVAVCLPADGHPIAAVGLHLFAARVKTDCVPVSAAALGAHLAAELPRHMQPAQLQVVDAVPLTANGKVDRAALAELRVTTGDGERVAGGEEPLDDLERRVAAQFVAALGVTGIGRGESLFDLGGDSLVLARLVGRIREEIPEAAGIFFDRLIRLLQAEPTVAAAAEFLRGAARDTAAAAQDAGTEPAGVPAGAGNAMFVDFGGTTGPVRVLLHEALGTMAPYRALARELVDQDVGPVRGVAVARAEPYLAIDPADLVGRLADEYAGRLLESGHREFQLIGYCLGGMLATEVARRLQEHGAEVRDLTLISSHPLTFDVEEELMIEGIYLRTVGVDPVSAGFGPVDMDAVQRAYRRILTDHDGTLPAGALAAVHGDPALDALAAMFRSLAERGQDGRFERYTAAMGAQGGAMLTPEQLRTMYPVFRQGFGAARTGRCPTPGTSRSSDPSTAQDSCPGSMWTRSGSGTRCASVPSP